MEKFRCPRCGAVVEGLHDRCPRCRVLFKYRKEDIELLTPYKAPESAEPERIEVKPQPEPLPEDKKEEILPPEPVKEEPKPEPEPEPEPDYTPNKKAKSASFIFGLVGLLLGWFLGYHLIQTIFGAVALGKAKKAKPIKATGGKVLGIIDLILGIMGLLWTAFVLFLIFVALVVGVILVILNWEVIAPYLGLEGEALALLLAL